jgi:hypothetical protein
MYVQEGVDLRVIYDEDVIVVKEKFPDAKVVSFEEFEAFYQGSRTLAFMHEHTCVGGMIVHEQHLHLVVCRAFHGKWARLWPAAFKWALSVCDPLYALMPVDNEKIIQFISSVGGQFEKEEVAYGGLQVHRYRLESAHMKYPHAARKRHAARACIETDPELAVAPATPCGLKESAGMVGA